MTTTQNRRAIRNEILTRVAAQPAAPDQVLKEAPGDALGPEGIWFESYEGVEYVIPDSVGGRKMRDDTYRLRFRVFAAGSEDIDATGARLDELIGCFEDVLADDMRLGTDDTDASISNLQGPFDLDTTIGPRACGAVVEITVVTRLL